MQRLENKYKNVNSCCCFTSSVIISKMSEDIKIVYMSFLVENNTGNNFAYIQKLRQT